METHNDKNARPENALAMISLKNKSKDGRGIYKKRVLIGSSEACDVVFKFNDISAIHAVLEVLGDNRYKIYDMNSTNGTYVNGQKCVASEFTSNDTLRLSLHEIKLGAFVKNELPPPILENIPTPLQTISKLPKSPELNKVAQAEIPRIVYPLAKDPKADFTEYIFEDAQNLYPIFKYEVGKFAVEVIILFKDKIFSVDYLPESNGTYFLAGSEPNDKSVEFAYLGKKDKIHFIDVTVPEISVHNLPGYKPKLLSDRKSQNVSAHTPTSVMGDDILVLEKGEIQIFVRRTDSPPKVDAAPFFNRDEDLKKYLALMIFIVLAFMTSLQFIPVDKEIEKEKAPERIATILYKKLPAVTKSIAKTENKPKEVVQKDKKIKPPEKITKPNEKQATPDKVENTQHQARTGDTTAKKITDPKKVPPKQANKDVIKDVVRNNVNQNNKSPKARPGKRASKVASPHAGSRGHVDTYKAADFQATVSALLTKGSGSRSNQGRSSVSNAGDLASDGVESGGPSATVSRASVSKDIGSLTGSATGKLDSSKGVDGLSNKKSMYTAGLPYKTVILGGMDPDTIRRILIENIPHFRYCYQKVLDRAESAFNGIVRLDFIIGASGHVTKASVESADENLPGPVKECVVNVLRGIKFPAPMGGGVVEVNQPFNFYPKIK